MNQLKALRLERGMSQAGLAKAAGLNRMTVMRIEAGRLPNLSTATKLGKALGLDWRFLFGQSATEKKQRGKRERSA